MSISNQKIGGQSESNRPEQTREHSKFNSTGISTKTSSSETKKSNYDHLPERRSRRKKLKSDFDAQEDICPPVTDDYQLAVPSSVKRTFSEIEISPEPLESQAKKRNIDYKRFFDIPEETARNHTGLTGTFSTFQIGDLLISKGDEAAENSSPKRSSPISVAKSLFSELEEPVEDVFKGGAADLSHSSFTSPFPGNGNICRSLSLDSDGSIYETSLIVDSHTSALHPNKPAENTLPTEENEKNKNPTNTELVAMQTPKLGQCWRKAESQCSLLSSLPDHMRSVASSPSFLKPRNGVVFRSYCSSINRSNMSGVSRLSVGSLEAMDVSSSASYHSAFGNATPVQRRPNSSSSVYQVGMKG